jgi:hypothetical protein
MAGSCEDGNEPSCFIKGRDVSRLDERLFVPKVGLYYTNFEVSCLVR